jgi:hypothetical protein
MGGGISYEYEKLNSEDQKTFRRWFCVNIVVGAILLAGAIVLAWKVPGDQSGAATAQHAVRTQANLPPERASALPSR